MLRRLNCLLAVFFAGIERADYIKPVYRTDAEGRLDLMRFQPKSLVLISLLSIGFLAGCEGSVSGGKSAGDKVDIFAKGILPILQAKCGGASCHSSGGGGASFFVVSTSSSQTYQSFKPLVVAGDAAASPVHDSMGSDFLTTQEWTTIDAWINAGAEQFGEDGGIEPPPPVATNVGMDACANYCHIRQAELWLASPHGNYESYNSSTYTEVDNGLNNTGFPTVEMLGEDECAYFCHDPISDGRQNLIAGFTGDRPRPVIGCESCHGGGSDHFTSPGEAVAYTSPNYERCGQCHSETTSEYGHHDQYHPEAKSIKEEFAASPHFESRNSQVMAGGSDMPARCARCHSDEGARLYRWVEGTYDAVVENIPDIDPAVATTTNVECRTCHAVHDEGNLLKEATSGSSAASAEYNTCTHCHAVENAFHGEKNDYSWTYTGREGGKDYYLYDGDRIIYDTHGSDKASTDAKIEGYVIKKTSERACRDCHNVHSGEVEINRQWAESAHAGWIRNDKLAAAANPVEMDAGLVPSTEGVVPPVIEAGTTSPALVEDDWDSSSQQSCQRCHTSTGFKNYATTKVSGVWTPSAYVAANNDFSHLSGWSKINGTYTVSGQNELLYCWACHKDNAGGLNNPGAITDLGYGSKINGTAKVFAHSDLGSSNVCALCHSARGNMFKLDTNGVMSKLAPTATVSTGTATKTHYASAGATIYHATTRIGYEYIGLTVDGSNNPLPNPNYADPENYAHNKLGGALTGNVTDGPCVTCHMGGANHTYDVFESSVLEKDDPETLGVNEAGTCNAVACHNNLWSEDVIEAYADEYANALEALKDAIYRKTGGTATGIGTGTGILFSTSYPYFYVDKNNNGVLDGTDISSPATINWGKMGTFGAAHNLNYLLHEPGAFAHNSKYAKRLVFDSIYWCFNGDTTNMATGTIDLSTGILVTGGYPDAAAWLQADTNTGNDNAVARP